MYWTNFWQPTVQVQQNMYLTSSRFFWHILRPNWLIIPGIVSLCKMFENCQIAVFEGKCPQFRILPKFEVSLYLELLPNLDAKGAKRSVKMWTLTSLRVFSKILCCTHGRLSKNRSVWSKVDSCFCEAEYIMVQQIANCLIISWNIFQYKV